MAKKHGWVLEDGEYGGYVNESLDVENAVDVAGSTVMLFDTRKEAREFGYKLKTDIVRKVEVMDGKIVKVISERQHGRRL